MNKKNTRKVFVTDCTFTAASLHVCDKDRNDSEHGCPKKGTVRSYIWTGAHEWTRVFLDVGMNSHRHAVRCCARTNQQNRDWMCRGLVFRPLVFRFLLCPTQISGATEHGCRPREVTWWPRFTLNLNWPRKYSPSALTATNLENDWDCSPPNPG